MPSPPAVPSSPSPDVMWDLTKILLTTCTSLLVVGVGAILTGLVTFRMKRNAEHADECIGHLTSCAHHAFDTMRKLALGDAVEARNTAYLMFAARDKLGEEVNLRFSKSVRLPHINRCIAALDLAMDHADPQGEPITPETASQLDAFKGAIQTEHALARIAILKASRTWAYRVWGKHN